MEHDPEVRDILRRWQPPAAPAEMNQRMMARFAARRRPWWRKRLELRIALPAPLAAVAALLVLFWGYRAWEAESFRLHMGGYEPVAAPVIRVEGRP